MFNASNRADSAPLCTWAKEQIDLGQATVIFRNLSNYGCIARLLKISALYQRNNAISANKEQLSKKAVFYVSQHPAEHPAHPQNAGYLDFLLHVLNLSDFKKS